MILGLTFSSLVEICPFCLCFPGIHLDMWERMSYVKKYVHVKMYNIDLHVTWIIFCPSSQNRLSKQAPIPFDKYV